MSKQIVSKELVRRVARGLGEEESTTLPILASVCREGVEKALVRYPDHRGRLIREASILRERHLLDVPDIDSQMFETSGFKWTVTQPAGFENFQMVAHNRDEMRNHLRISFVAHDMAVGWSGDDSTKESRLDRVEIDPVLRVVIGRAVRNVARVYVERMMRSSKSMSGYFGRHLRAVTDRLFAINHILPVLTLKARSSPHLQGEEAHRVLVSAYYTNTFELAMVGRDVGGIIDGVEIQTNGLLFEIAGGVQTILKAADSLSDDEAAEEIEAISPQNRRRREKAILEEGPPKALHREVVVLDGEDEMELEIHSDDLTQLEQLEKQAGVRSDSQGAMDWWRSNSGLIKPTISEMATKAIASYGEGVSKGDLNVLIDLSFPSLQRVAQKRQSQFVEFSFDAAVVGLGRLLRQELSTRLR